MRYLSNRGVGTNIIEANQVKSTNEMIKDTGRRVKEIVDEMNRKAKDAEKEAVERSRR